jgi:hypothetical protein
MATIQELLDRINAAHAEISNAKEALRVALNGKGLSLSADVRLADYAAHVDEISTGVDVSGVTVTADTILDGFVAVDVDGNEIIGTIPTIEITNDGETIVVPSGFNPTEQTFNVSGVGIDTTTDNPPVASEIRDGKEVFANGVKIVGTAPVVTASVNGNTVTLPAGFHAEAETITIENGGGGGGDVVNGYSDLDVFDFMLILNQR